MEERPALLRPESLQELINVLHTGGYATCGPIVKDGAIVYDEIRTISDLPVGERDEQAAGWSRLSKRDDGAFFGFVHGPQSWKKFLFPSHSKIFSASRNAAGFKLISQTAESVKYAFIGVRPCEISAIAIQDKVFMGGAYVDEAYKSRRENVFVVAVNCAEPGGTCFCVSMGTGPSATSGYDIALTEIVEDGLHVFVARAGSEKGAEALARVTNEKADDDAVRKAEAIMKSSVSKMGRKLEREGIKELFYGSRDSLRWDKVAERCLTCANCTMVCPTCFCSTVQDVADLAGDIAERWRRWDSCFTMDFTYIHGGNVRRTTASRYRHWITHKLATWLDQFGVSGCVGCGRCITWCPVGIDITEEVAALRPSVERSNVDNRGNGHEKP